MWGKGGGLPTTLFWRTGGSDTRRTWVTVAVVKGCVTASTRAAGPCVPFVIRGMAGTLAPELMSDTRAAIRELRSLGEKRSTQGLTDQEQSRLAELRERLGLPSEPAESRSGGPRSGGAPSGVAAPASGSIPRQAVAAEALSPLEAPLEPAALPSFAPVPAPEPPAPALHTLVEASPPATTVSTDAPRLAPSELTGSRDQSPDVSALGAEEPGRPLAPDASTASRRGIERPLGDVPRLAPDAPAPTTDADGLAAEPPLEALPELRAEALAPTTDADAVHAAPPLEALAELAPDAPTTDADSVDRALPMEAVPEFLPPAPPLEALPEMGSEALAPTTDADVVDRSPPTEARPGLAPDVPAPTMDPDGLDAALPLEALPELQSAALEEPTPAWGAADGVVPEDADLAAPARPPSSLAERIDAAVNGLESEPDWGAVPVTPGPIAEEGAETFVAADLGAIPLDIADPAVDPAYAEGGAIIELSAADVVLLDGEPADPVPLAALHEFVGEQAVDPRALDFDDQGEQPTLPPEDLQASEAELAAAPEAFRAAAVPAPEPNPPPAPVPPAPRVSLPRPPPPPAPPAPIALTRESPPAAAPDRRVTPAPPRAPAPPPPPAAALAEAAARVPTLSAARPEPPRRAGFGQSGPFARPPAVLMAPASLDVMDEEPVEPIPPPTPQGTDVAAGAEVFGGAYLSPTFVEGEHRVVLHTLEGQVRRGTVKDLDLLDAVVRLASPGRPPEAIAAERVKAIFFMQEPGAAPLPSTGRRIRVGFADGRQIVGFSDDVDTGEQGFFLVPADTRTHTARIYVFRAGVQSISAA